MLLARLRTLMSKLARRHRTPRAVGTNRLELEVLEDRQLMTVSFEFSSSKLTVPENIGSASVTINLVGRPSGEVSIELAVAGGTATVGSDFTDVSQRLTFADGETSKTVNIPVIDDGLVEGDETVNLSLNNPTVGGVTVIGTVSTVVLTITDNDVASPLDAWVRALYRKVLNRLGDDAGIAFWVGQLQAGVPRFQVALFFHTLPERRILVVNQFYQQILGRAADPLGQATWVEALLSGRLSEAQVVAALLTSAEYTAAHPDAASFVQGVYQAILRRASDPSEVSFYAPFAQGENGRAQVVLVILGSQEAFTTAIQDIYREALGRDADVAGLQFWLGIMNQGQVTPPVLGAYLYASDEFFALAPTIPGIWP